MPVSATMAGRVPPTKLSQELRDVLLAVVLTAVGLGYSVSGLPANIIVACVIWTLAWFCVCHLFLISDWTELCPPDVKLVFLASCTFLLMLLMWTPVRNQYAKEHKAASPPSTSETKPSVPNLPRAVLKSVPKPEPENASISALRLVEKRIFKIRYICGEWQDRDKGLGIELYDLQGNNEVLSEAARKQKATSIQQQKSQEDEAYHARYYQELGDALDLQGELLPGVTQQTEEDKTIKQMLEGLRSPNIYANITDGWHCREEDMTRTADYLETLVTRAHVK